MRAHPSFPWLDVRDADGMAAFLVQRGWLDAGETIRRCERAGEGNMNLTVRVHTDRRRVVLKQARPWVEKYDHIAAPWDRAAAEQRFYERAATLPAVAARMPRVLGSDAASCVLLLDDLPGARDMTSLYAGDAARPDEVDVLADWLRALHDGTRGVDAAYANRAMRALNHEHCFVIPLATPPALDLEPFEPGLTAAAAGLAADAEVRAAVDALGRRYLADGACLVHADYFPGSWLRTDDGLRVIDPEFSFPGDREVDLGGAVAHLTLADQAPSLARRLLARYGEADPSLVARYAAVEIVRRLIGVAQLPLAPSTGRRAELLARVRAALRGGGLEALSR
jgi:5-methylthioribose kinase